MEKSENQRNTCYVEICSFSSGAIELYLPSREYIYISCNLFKRRRLSYAYDVPIRLRCTSYL